MPYGFAQKVLIFASIVEIILILIGKYTKFMFGQYNPFEIAGILGIFIAVFLLVTNYIVFKKIEGKKLRKYLLNFLVILFLFASLMLIFDFFSELTRIIYGDNDKSIIIILIFLLIAIVTLIFQRSKRVLQD